MLSISLLLFSLSLTLSVESQDLRNVQQVQEFSVSCRDTWPKRELNPAAVRQCHPCPFSPFTAGLDVPKLSCNRILTVLSNHYFAHFALRN